MTWVEGEGFVLADSDLMLLHKVMKFTYDNCMPVYDELRFAWLESNRKTSLLEELLICASDGLKAYRCQACRLPHGPYCTEHS